MPLRFSLNTDLTFGVNAHLNEFSGELVGAGSHNAYTLDKAEQKQQTLKVKSSYVPRKHFFSIKFSSLWPLNNLPSS
jgi:hypothetical protein